MRLSFTAWGLAAFVVLASCSASAHETFDLSPVLKQMENRDFSTACIALRRLSTRNLQSVDVWNLLGVCESELHQHAAARSAFEHALRLEPLSSSVNQNAGFFFFQQSDFANAKRCLSRVVASGAAEPGVVFNLAVAEQRTGDTAASLRHLLTIESSLEKTPEYWEQRGWVELSEHSASASVSFDRALALAPDSLRALHGAASVAEAQRQDEKAVSFLLRARQVAPDDLSTLLHFGSVCLKRDLTLDALAALQHAHELAPDNRVALFLYARAELANQQWQRSSDLFTDYAKRWPKDAAAQFALGWLALKLDQPKEARAYLTKSLQLLPDQPDVLAELAQMDLDEGRSDKARQSLLRALHLEPAHVRANLVMGDLEMQAGQRTEARSRYEAAISSDPSNGPAHYKLSVALLRLGDQAGAEQERDLSVKLNAQATQASKTVLRLAGPDGTLLAGEPVAGRGSE